MEKEQKRVFELSNELLEIVDNVDEFARSDLQGVLEAFVLKNCKLN